MTDVWTRAKQARVAEIQAMRALDLAQDKVALERTLDRSGRVRSFVPLGDLVPAAHLGGDPESQQLQAARKAVKQAERAYQRAVGNERKARAALNRVSDRLNPHRLQAQMDQDYLDRLFRGIVQATRLFLIHDAVQKACALGHTTQKILLRLEQEPFLPRSREMIERLGLSDRVRYEPDKRWSRLPVLRRK